MENIFKKKPNFKSRCYNFENTTLIQGQAGRENICAKGHAFDIVNPNESKVLFDVKCKGVIDHMWFTFQSVDGVLSPLHLRGLKLEMYWDGAGNPAVSVPFGDFFGLGLGKTKSYENELFSSPGGKAFNSYVKMPFLNSAKIVLTNDTDVKIANLFYTINYHIDPDLDDILYFHAYWRRENPTAFKKDFEVLPKVNGSGRFLGTCINVIGSPDYPGTWWGEGEVKIYLDGDKEYPTIIGTGTEDYIGIGWGLTEFNHRFQGCLVANEDRWSFYRYHINDPIYFNTDCKVTIQQIGGGSKESLLALKDTGVLFELVSVDPNNKNSSFIKVYETEPRMQLDDERIKLNDWCNFYRVDDWCSTSYLYLDNCKGVLPPVAGVEERLDGITDRKGEARNDA